MDDDTRGLVPIGHFARLTQLTVRALRLYDERGLLRPAVVDIRSGYRYYGLDQVETAKRIKTLRLLEMPLGEIWAVLQASDPSVARSSLSRHEHRIQERIAKYRVMLRALHTDDELCSRGGKERPMEQQPKPYACSFCGKDNGKVKRLIAGPNGVFICDECVERCNEILAKEGVAEQPARR